MDHVVASRYATALFNAAEKSGELEAVGEDLKGLSAAIGPSGLLGYLDNPRFSLDQNLRVLQKLGALFSSDLTTAFLSLLVKKDRVGLFFAIASHFLETRRRAEGRISAEVVLAGSPNRALLERIEETIGKITQKKVDMDVRQDAALLGGIFIRIGNRVLDGSIRTRIAQLKKTLLETQVN